jgi:mannose-6-phosphate isomerase-like protein (cupin superfamily)
MLTTATIRTPADVVREPVLGGSITVLLRGEETDGRLGLVEQEVPAGYPGPPLHVHPDFDEGFLVLEGSLALVVGDETLDAGPGTVTWIARGTSHTFANRSGAAARSLVWATPAGHEKFFEALVELVRGSGGMPAPAALAALNAEFGTVPV